MSDHHPHHAPVRSSPYISEYDHHHHHIRLVTSNNGDDALLSHDALLDEKDNGHHLLPPPSTGAEELRKCGCDPPNPICPRKLHRATQKHGFSGVRYLPFWCVSFCPSKCFWHRFGIDIGPVLRKLKPWRVTLQQPASPSPPFLSHLRQRPHPRQEWVEHPTADANSGTVYVNTLALSHEHRAASASDLVLDLVFVVLLAGLGRSFRAELSVGDSAEHTKIAVRDFVSLFLPMYLQWSAILKFLNQCETRDVINIIFFIGNFLLMAAAGVSSERCGNATSRKGCKEYAWSIAGARLWVVLFTLHFIWYNRKYARCLLVYTSFDCLVLLSWLVTGFMPGGEECGNVINECWGGFVALWWFAISIDLIRAFGMELLLMCGLHLGTADVIPVNTALLAERYQLFVILSIGEVVTASLASDGYSGDARRRLGLSEASHGDDEHDDGEAEESSSSAPRINVVLLIIGLALLTKLYYFDVPDCAEPQPSGTPAVLRKHALATSATRGMMWIFHHLVCERVSQSRLS